MLEEDVHEPVSAVPRADGVEEIAVRVLELLVDERPRTDDQRREVQLGADLRRQDELELAAGDVGLSERRLEERVMGARGSHWRGPRLTRGLVAIPTGIEGAVKDAPFPEDSARFAIGGEGVPREPERRAPAPPTGRSQPLPPVPHNAEPLTVAVLWRKLDAAIVAEAWDAVKAIQQRIVALERGAAGNVVDLAAERGKRGAP